MVRFLSGSIEIHVSEERLTLLASNAKPHFNGLGLALFLVVAALGCGGETGGKGGGDGGAGPIRQDGDCSDPLDFEAHHKEMGRIPFIEGSRDGAAAEQVGSCGGLGAEVVIAWTAKKHGMVEIGPIQESPGLILYARRACGDPLSEIACSRERRLPSIEVQEGETLYVMADTNGGVPYFELAFNLIPLLGDGDVCVPQATAGICKEGLRCKSGGHCAANIPPIITKLLVAENEAEGKIKVRAYGEAPDRNTTHVVYTFFDEEGEPSSKPQKANIQQIQKEPEFWVSHSIKRSDVMGAVSVQAQFLDAFGGEGNILEQAIAPSPIRMEGEECDPDPYFGTCSDGLYCESETKDPPICEPLPPEGEGLR